MVRRDLVAAHAPDALPEALRDATGEDALVIRLRDAVCDLLRRYWTLAIEPAWPRMRLVLEADMTYRARRLSMGGARLLFADMHPNLRWHDGVLHIAQMISSHDVAASGRGLLLVPSVFSHKPAPPVSPDDTRCWRTRAAVWRPCGPRTAATRRDGAEFATRRTPSETPGPPGGATLDGGTRPPPPRDPERRVTASARPARHGPAHPGTRRTAGPVPPQRPR